MLPIRCPQCGLTNYPDDISFPRCGQCHEDLVRCPGCRHWHANACRHPKASERYTSNGEAAKTCAAFRSRHAVNGPRMRWNIPAPLWVSALLLIIMCSLAAAAWFIDPAGRYFRGNPLRLETTVPTQVAFNQPFTVTMLVTNLLNQTSTKVYIAIDDDFLAMASPAMPIPTPERIDRDDGQLVMEFSPLPAGGRRIIQLPFIPQQRGVAPFAAKIYAPSNQLRHEVNVPILIGQGMIVP